MFIEVLGAYGSKTNSTNLSCFKLTEKLYIDAGNLTSLSLDELKKVDYILLTHAHLDHILDIPFVVDNVFTIRKKPISIITSKVTIDFLKEFILNKKVWPAFHDLKYNNRNILEFMEVKEGAVLERDGVKIEVFVTNHDPLTLGFIINDDTVICGDTYISDKIKEIVIQDRIKNLVIEVSFPSEMEKLAIISKHMTPTILNNFIKEIRKEKKTELNLFIYHMKANYIDVIESEIKLLDELKNASILKDGDVIDTEHGIKISTPNVKLIDLLDITKAISYESNIDKILDMIITYARKVTNSEGGSLYIKSDDDKELVFKIIQNDRLNIYLKGNEIKWPSLPLYINGKPNDKMVASFCALNGEAIRIDDAYDEKHFDFSGTKKFDRMNNYRSKSMLVVPLKNHEGEIIGVLQLINKIVDGKIIGFTEKDEQIVKTLAGIAAVTLTKNQYIRDFERLFDSLIKTLAVAIDKKSQHTKGHVERVALLSKYLAKEASLELSEVSFNEDELRSIEIAGWLHDIGKISTPEHILNKAKKLENIYDGIEFIKLKIELLKKDLQMKVLEGEMSKEEYKKEIIQLEKDLEFLEEINYGKETMHQHELERIKNIANKKVFINGKKENLLNEYEVKCLSIEKGTLLEEEKEIIMEHALSTLEMLSEIYFPKKFKQVIHIASNHHEKLNGTGYPRGLKAEDLSVEDRILAVADIFDALASDRPYKKSKKLSEIFEILYEMVLDNEIDKDIVSLLLTDKILNIIKESFLEEDQIDEIDPKILEFFKINE
jgi:HD-GYP domain-containing protein (c-di-GMP phosphodiesterase class II)